VQDHTDYLEETFVIWNPTFGVRDIVMLGVIEGDKVWLDDPYDMVGPLDTKRLLADGEIPFAACVVMTQKKWQENRDLLQKASYQKQRKIQEEFQKEIQRRNRRRKRDQIDEKECRELLCLPAHGVLKVSQIKTAYRQVAKQAHPDVGGSQTKFVEITKARDILLEQW